MKIPYLHFPQPLLASKSVSTSSNLVALGNFLIIILGCSDLGVRVVYLVSKAAVQQAEAVLVIFRSYNSTIIGTMSSENEAAESPSHIR